jgi:hypothetical protein
VVSKVEIIELEYKFFKRTIPSEGEKRDCNDPAPCKTARIQN